MCRTFEARDRRPGTASESPPGEPMPGHRAPPRLDPLGCAVGQTSTKVRDAQLPGPRCRNSTQRGAPERHPECLGPPGLRPSNREDAPMAFAPPPTPYTATASWCSPARRRRATWASRSPRSAAGRTRDTSTATARPGAAAFLARAARRLRGFATAHRESRARPPSAGPPDAQSAPRAAYASAELLPPARDPRRAGRPQRASRPNFSRRRR